MSYAIFVIGVLLKVPGSMAGKSVERSTIILEISKQRSEKTTKRLKNVLSKCVKYIGNFVFCKFANILLKMAPQSIITVYTKIFNT